MAQGKRPTKQQVREWMESRTHQPEPPPTPEEIRRQLGWELFPELRRPDRIEQD